MNLQEIKVAVESGKTVHCYNTSYEVIKDNKGQWLIVCTFNQWCSGLTETDGVTLNGKPEEFFIA